ncbi:MAG: GxxExxY protein [Candidatus Latescibacteria bacterium]|nr:GxxExxY protein [Candidatus Latescibacterota bacterium]
MDNTKNKNLITQKIIGCCFKVHRELGPGFNEKIYHNALKALFDSEGLKYETEKEFEILFFGKRIGFLRADLVVENQVMVEIKSLAGNIPAVFIQQLLAYLKASGLHIGLLINFGNKSCQIKRLVF